MAKRPKGPTAAVSTDASSTDTSSRKVRKLLWDRARYLRKEGPWLVRSHRARIGEGVAWAVADEVRAIDVLLKQGWKQVDFDVLYLQIDKVNGLLEQHFAGQRKSDGRRNVEAISAALLIALFIRAFMFEPYRIPSGSMLPTLLVGDYLFVAKFTYGLSIPYTDKVIFDWRKPKRGEVVIFEHPKPDQNREILIKRVMAVPGDHVRFEENVWYVNGEPWGAPKVLHRSAPCYLTPGQTCTTLEPTGDGRATETAGCGCEFIEYTDGVKTWVTQHIAPNSLCRCTVPEDVASCIPFVGGGQSGMLSIIGNQPDWPTQDQTEFLSGWPWDGTRWRGLVSERVGAREMVVPEEHVVVLGDNRDNSADSRYWGLVPIDHVRGKALFIWLNTSHPGRIFHSVH